MQYGRTLISNIKNFPLPKFTLFQKLEKPIGLYNINLNCYMNSVIQCLFHMTEFSEYFINKDFSQIEQPISCELKNIFKTLKDRNDGKTFNLKKFKEIMGEFDDSFSESNGADAADLLSYIFSSLSGEQTNYIGLDISMMSRLDSNEKEDVFKDCKDKVGDDSALIYIMNYIQTEYKCFSFEMKKIGGKNTRIFHKPFYSFENKCFIEFDLEELLKKENQLNLNQIFYYYFNKQNKSKEFCPQCNKNTNCNSETNLYKISDYLIIILKQKKNKKIKIDYDENINIANFVEDFRESKIKKSYSEYFFRLVGVILHLGDSSSYGHYISCCRNCNNEKKIEKVYLFNDAIVKEVEFNQIKQHTPYILFYEKYYDKSLKYNYFKRYLNIK